MTKSTDSTRRAFLKGGAVLAAPLAGAGAAAAAAPADPGASRLAELENLEAIRELHRGFIRHVNAGDLDAAAALFAAPDQAGLDASVRRLEADAMAAPEAVDLAVDGRSATVRIGCTVHSETPVQAAAPLETVASMARQQGAGAIRQSGERVLETACVKEGGTWKIARAAYAPA